jgi:hypothetical protein
MPLADVVVLNQLTQALRRCHEVRVSTYGTLVNAAIWVFVIGIATLIIYVCYKNKLPPVDRAWREKQEEQDILHQIQLLRDQAQNPLHVDPPPITAMSTGRVPDTGSASLRDIPTAPLAYNPNVF